MQSRWLTERQYRLYIPTDALADITGEGNDSITLNLTVADPEKSATIRLNLIPRTEGALYIIQLLSSSNQLQREFTLLGGGEQLINYVPTGEMRIRVIEDLNGNGRWDSGNLVERRQSERAEFYKNEQQEELFTMKAGWEFDFPIDMSKLFAPVTMEQLIERLDSRERVRLQKEEEKRREQNSNGSGQSGGQSSGGRSSLSGMTGGAGGMGGMMGGMSGMGGASGAGGSRQGAGLRTR